MNTLNATLIEKIIEPFKAYNIKILFQPPKKNMVEMALIIIMLPYSAKKNKAKRIDEYSTL